MGRLSVCAAVAALLAHLAAAQTISECAQDRSRANCSALLAHCASSRGFFDDAACAVEHDRVYPVYPNTGYKWLASLWGDCSQECGNAGSRSRSIQCVLTVGAEYGEYEAVKDGFCDADLREWDLEATGSCNVLECESVGWQAGDWRDCCLEGADAAQWRPVHCLSSRGRVLPWEACGTSSIPSLWQACECSATDAGARYDTARWGLCAAGEEQTQTRALSCVDGDGDCAGLEAPETERACAAAGADPALELWALPPSASGRAVTECSAYCSSGSQTLVAGSAVCLNATGGSGGSGGECAGREPPAEEVACGTERCSFCDAEECSGQGLCRVSSFGLSRDCLCEVGMTGDYCDVHELCNEGRGRTDGDGHCCESGVLDAAGGCCAASDAGVVLDGDGECCAAGEVDVCGVCGGSSTLVDLAGDCCSVLGADGLCCESGRLDDCGVCDGDHSSCAAGYAATVKLPYALRAGLSAETVGGQLGIDALRVTAGTVSGSRVQTYHLNLSALDPPLARHHIYSKLDGWDEIAMQYVHIDFACGNGLCEPGELCADFPDEPDDHCACAADCPFVMHACPSSGGAYCSGHGRCVGGTGVCACFAGFVGDDCRLCDFAGGWREDGDGGCERLSAAAPRWRSAALTNLSVASASGAVRPLTPAFNASALNQTRVRMEMRSWEAGVYIDAAALADSGARVEHVRGNDSWAVDAGALFEVGFGETTVPIRVKAYDYELSGSHTWYYLVVYRDHTEGSAFKTLFALLACALGLLRAKTLWWAAEERRAKAARYDALVARAYTFTDSYRADVERVERRRRYKEYARYRGNHPGDGGGVGGAGGGRRRRGGK